MIISENCKIKDEIICFVETYEYIVASPPDFYCTQFTLKFADECDLNFVLLESVYKKRIDKLIENDTIFNTFKEKYNCHDFIKDTIIHDNKTKLTSFKEKFMIFDDIEIKITDF